MKKPFKKLEPYTNWRGERMFADGGITRGEKKPMFKCECSGRVVWVKNSKTGKNYLANCFRYGRADSDYESYWYGANSPHFRTCDEQAKLRDQMREGR